MFAGSCVGVVLLVMSLEFLRRASKEYDQYILRQAQREYHQATSIQASVSKSPNSNETTVSVVALSPLTSFRPTIFQQAVRAGFHTVQFAVAYLVMLLAMYYNGYIIISIIIGAYLGAFVFSWEMIKIG
jgi:copper transporter 1